MQKAKWFLCGLGLLLLSAVGFSQQLKLGKNPYVVNKSAVLELESSNQGLLFPRIADTAQINLLGPPDGMVIFYIPSLQLLLRTSGFWKPLTVSSALNSYWSLNGNGSTTASNFLGTTDLRSINFRTNNSQVFLLDSLGNAAIGNAPTFTTGVNQEKFLVDGGAATTSYNLISGKGNINNYLQLNIQNKSAGNAASSDVIATNDQGTEANGINFIDMGINSSGYSNTGVLGGVSNAYLYSTGNDLIIGNASVKPLRFFTGGTATTNERLRIDSIGNVGFGLTVPTALLHLKAGTTTANTAPLKFTSGPLMTAPQIGAFEFLTDKFYATITTGTARKEFTLNDGVLTSGRVPYASTNGRLIDNASLTFSGTRLSTYLTLPAGTATVAPLLMTSGPVLTTPASGAIEYNGTHFYGTVGASRFQLDQQAGTVYTGSNGIALAGNDFRNTFFTGIAGDQTIVAGTASGNSLTLSSTSNVTKGKILFGTSGYNEAANRLGLGNNIPTEVLDVTGNLKFSGALMPGNNAGTAGYYLTSTGAGTSPTWNVFDTTSIAAFSQKVRSLFSATGPVTYSNGQIGINQATTSTDGYLSSADWNTFNNKAGAYTSGDLTETGSSVLTITGGTNAVLGSGTTLLVKQANGSQSGFLTSADWNTFNNKLSTVDTTNIANFYLKSRSLLSAGTGIGYNSGTGVISNSGVLSVNGNAGALTMDTTYISSFSQKTRSLFGGIAPITYANGQIGITQAGLSTDGYLSSSDWAVFNNKASTANVWSLFGNSGTVSGTNFIGTTDLKSFKMRTNNNQVMLLDSLGNVGIGTSPGFTSGVNREKLLVDAGATGSYNVISGKGTINNYLQLNIQNKSSGSNASSDIVATADNGDEISNYVDLGINSSGNTSGYGGANDAYLYNTGQNFFIGTGTPNKILSFMIGGGQSSNEKMRIDGSGNVGIGTTTPSNRLSVLGTNPLYLGGVQTGTTTDSLLMITNGLVRKLHTSALTSLSVTSVGLSLPSIFTVSGSPVTSTGTLTATLTNQAANQFFAGPSTGSATVPTFRPLDPADLPIATTTAVGGVSIGTGLAVTAAGVLSTTSSAPSGTAGGDLTGTYPNPTLATVNSNTGTFGSTTVVPQITVNGKGLITAVSSQSIAFPVTSVNTLTGAVSLGISNMNDATITSPSNNQILRYNGTKWVNTTPSYISSAITSLNGLTVATQTFATPGTSGTAPVWSSTGSVHTLNIPLASAASVTGGLLSNTDWTTFNNKLSTVDTTNISNFYIKSRSLLSAGTGITYNAGTGVISSSVSTASLWAYNGNTVGAIKNFGTIDNYALPFITNNTEKMRLTTAGYLGIGNTSPGNYLDVSGTVAGTGVSGLRLNGLGAATAGAANSKVLSVNSSGDVIVTTNPSASLWSFTGNSGLNPPTNFLGMTDDKQMVLKSNNVSFLEFGRRQTLGLNDGFTDYNDNDEKVTFMRSAIQFDAPAANFYKPKIFTDVNGNFRIKGSSAGTDYFEMGSTGTNNNGGFEFIIGDDGDEPMVFKSYNYQTGLSEIMRLQSGRMAVGSNAFDATNPEKLLIDAGATNSYNLMTGKGSIDNYLQINVKNSSATANASSDMVASSDNGTETVNYIDMGINSSAYSNTGYPILNGANNAYLYATGNDFLLGNATASKNLTFFTGGTALANERMRIDGSGNIGIGTITPLNKLSVVGTNPLYLAGVQTGSLADSFLMINGGIVKKLSVSTLTNAAVTSVGLSLPSIFTVSGSPVTSSGTLTGTFNTQAANSFFAGPSSGGAAVPAFRALTATDLPAGTANTSNTWTTTGNSGTASGTNYLGTSNSQSLVMRTNGIQGLILDSLGSVGVGSAPIFTAAPNREEFLVDAGTNVPNDFINVISGKGSTNNYMQMNIQNRSAGTAASSDVVASNNAGSESANYIDMGINSSGNTTTGVLGGNNTAYLYSTGNDFSIGNGTTNKVLKFFTGGLLDANERMRIDGDGKVGIGTGTATLLSDFTLYQKSTATATTRGFRFSGVPVSGTGAGSGFSMTLGYNDVNNKQLWLGDPEYLGNASSAFLRASTSSGYSVLDAVTGNNGSRRPLALGVGGDNSSGVIMGSDGNATIPGSYVWDNGNMAIGNGYRAINAPTNGLIVQGNVGIGTSSPGNRLDVEGTSTVVSFNRTGSNGTLVSLQRDGTEEGSITISGSTSGSRTVSYNAFTGSHYACTNQNIQKGELVTLSGNNQYFHDNKNSEIIYGIKASAQPNDPKILGAYLGLQESSKAPSNANPSLVMAVGNGEMWVVDKGDNIEVGDYLISSEISGHAMMDKGNYPLSFIIARVAEPVNWTKETEMINGVKHKLVSVFFENFIRNNSEKELQIMKKEIVILTEKLKQLEDQNERIKRLEEKMK